MNLEPQLAIGVISYERGGVTQRCLDSIAATTKTAYRIFLIDNGSRGSDTVRRLRMWADKKNVDLTVLDSNYGPSYARNLVLERADGRYPYIAMLDNDIIALKEWDTAAIKAIDNGADLVQPKLLEIDGQTVERGPNHPRKEKIAANPDFIGIGCNKADPVVDAESDVTIVGTASIVRNEVYESIGGYDDDLDIGEDYDISFRARNAGFSLRFAPECELIHDHGFDLKYDLVRSIPLKYLKSHIVIWRKHRKVLLSPQYMAWYSWLHFSSEPMYMPQSRSWDSLSRRIRRRLMKQWYMTRYSTVWKSESAADKATGMLAARISI